MASTSTSATVLTYTKTNVAARIETQNRTVNHSRRIKTFFFFFVVFFAGEGDFVVAVLRLSVAHKATN